MFIPNLEDMAFEIMNRAISGDKKKDEEDTVFADSLFDLVAQNEDESSERADTALKYVDKMIENEQERLDEKQKQYYLDFIHGKTDENHLNYVQSCYSVIFEMLFG